ncbi:MAG: Rossmann-like domain-containing protein [Oscillospiraceae bacterium]
MSKWDLYDRLIAGIAEDILVEDYAVGCAWTMMKAGGACGIALTVRQRAGKSEEAAPIIGQPLRKVAELVKSWNFIDASIGMAAINTFYNAPARLQKLGLLPDGGAEPKRNDAFSVFGSAVEGKKVTVIGHFPNIEKRLAPICELSVLEREPQKGDYPDSACEYILGEQDFVFITGMTLTNKTLPRLLELIRPDAQVCMVGPSVPLSDVLFSFGVDHLSGFCAMEDRRVTEAFRRGAKQGIFQGGQMVTYSARQSSGAGSPF